jgi:hypothetical protein
MICTPLRVAWVPRLSVSAEERRSGLCGVGAHAAEGEGRELGGRQLELRPLVATSAHRVAAPRQLPVAPRPHRAQVELLRTTH